MVAGECCRSARRALNDQGGAAWMAAQIAVALRAGAVEDGLARHFQRAQDRIWIRQWRRPCADGVGQSLHARRRELRALEGRQVVKEARRWVDRDPRMSAQRAQRLGLQSVKAAVQLVAAILVRSSRRSRTDAIGAGDVGVEDRRNGASDVGDGLGGRQGRRGAWNRRAAVEEFDVRGQWDRHAYQAVLEQARVVVRRRAVATEVIGVDRPEQGIVDATRPAVISMHHCIRHIEGSASAAQTRAVSISPFIKQRVADLDQGNSHIRRLIRGAKHLHGSPADRDGLVHISSQRRPLGQVEECPGGGATRTGLFGQCKCDSRSLPRQREIATEDANLRGTRCAEVSADKRCARANGRS